MLRPTILTLSHRVSRSIPKSLSNFTAREPSPQYAKTNPPKRRNTSVREQSSQYPKINKPRQSSMLTTSSNIIEAATTAAIIESSPTAIQIPHTPATTTRNTPVVVSASATAASSTTATATETKPWPFNLPVFLRPKAGTTYYETYTGNSSKAAESPRAAFLQRVLYGDPQPGTQHRAQAVDVGGKR